MTNPGVWVLGDLSDDDRGHGMGVVVEYAGQNGDPQWAPPPPFKWDYRLFAEPNPAPVAPPDHTLELLIEKRNAADNGFNIWTINGAPFAMDTNKPVLDLHQNKRYRLRIRNATDDLHPMHLHRHTFEITHIAGTPTAGVHKTSRCWAAIKAWRSTSSPTNPDCRCCTATSRYTWTTAS